MPPSWPSVLRDAAIVVVASSALALAANALRSERKIPLIAEKEYEILVPCPEFVGKPAVVIPPEQVNANEPGLLLVDAREQEAYARWHLPGAISIPYDYLEPKPEERQVLKRQARRVIVYGDGENPDSGQQLANAISAKGVKHVFFVKGGAPALRRSRP
jgi:rhodanese-related sulfurtransferase